MNGRCSVCHARLSAGGCQQDHEALRQRVAAQLLAEGYPEPPAPDGLPIDLGRLARMRAAWNRGEHQLVAQLGPQVRAA